MSSAYQGVGGLIPTPLLFDMSNVLVQLGHWSPNYSRLSSSLRSMTCIETRVCVREWVNEHQLARQVPEILQSSTVILCDHA